MKKQLFVIALAATVLAGCQKEDFSAPEARQEGGKTVLTATVNQTRSTVSEDGLFAWAEDDDIAVMTPADTFARFVLTGGSNTSVATFTSVADNVKAEKVAVFPENIAQSVSGKSLTVKFPSTLPYITDRTYSPMVAVLPEGGSQPEKAEFKHLCGLIAVTYNHVPQGLPSGAKYFYIRSEKQRITGEFTVADYTAENAVIETSNTENVSKLWVAFPDDAVFEGPTTFYVPIPVGAYDSLTVGFLDADYYFLEETRRGYKDVVVERADMRTTSFDNLAWDITYDYRGQYDQREDGRDVIRFWNIPGKWQYTTIMHNELNGYGYNGDILKVIENRTTSLKASSTAKAYEGNYRINFNPFPAKQTFHVIAFQIDDEYNFIGNYIHRSWTPKEKGTCSEGFNKWLGTWLASGKDAEGNDSTYVLTISTKANDELYSITGWASSSTALQAEYNATTGGLVVKTYMTTYKSNQKSSSDGLTYQCRGGFFGCTANGPQKANTTLCTGTIDDSGTTATLEGYTYYTNSPFVTMGMFWFPFDTSANKYWHQRQWKLLMRFPVTLTKVEVD
ncbi:MAG: hypothetical protein J5699_03180 [Bacteroidales bacterium]|nr:hypothetical protein [Bacteroidales bacterium]